MAFLLYFCDEVPKNPIFTPLLALIKNTDAASAVACHQKVIFPNSYSFGIKMGCIFLKVLYSSVKSMEQFYRVILGVNLAKILIILENLTHS